MTKCSMFWEYSMISQGPGHVSRLIWHVSPTTTNRGLFSDKVIKIAKVLTKDHRSPVIFYLLPITCNMFYLLPITCNMLPVPLSPVICHLSPVTWKTIFAASAALKVLVGLMVGLWEVIFFLLQIFCNFWTVLAI